MNVSVGLRNCRVQLVLTAGVIVSLLVLSPGRAQAQGPKQPNLAFRALASTGDAKDAEAIKAWKEAFTKAATDDMLKQKLDEAASSNKPPALLVPKKEGDKKKDPARYQFIRISADDLGRLGLNPTAATKDNKKAAEAINEARKKKEGVEVANLYLFSWKGTGDEVSYAVLARPQTDEGKLSGKDVESVRTAQDKEYRWGVLIKLTDSGGKQFKQFTQDNKNHFLVILVGPRMVHAAKLGGTFEGKILEISGQLDGIRAEDIRARVQSCIPPKETEKDNGKDKDKDSNKDK
jgi:hypothetical protein